MFPRECPRVSVSRVNVPRERPPVSVPSSGRAFRVRPGACVACELVRRTVEDVVCAGGLWEFLVTKLFVKIILYYTETGSLCVVLDVLGLL